MSAHLREAWGRLVRHGSLELSHAKPLSDSYWGEGGCGYLAVAMVTMRPELKIAVEWDARDHTVNHAVAYDPSGGAYDYMGSHPSIWVAMPGFSGGKIEEDVSPSAVAQSMRFNWSPSDPWISNRVVDAANLLCDEWGCG